MYKADDSNMIIISSDTAFEDIYFPADWAKQNLTANEISNFLEKLSLRESKLLSLKFGLNGEIPHTINEIAEVLEINQKRVMQIECKAYRRIKLLRDKSKNN
jgi:RNA polymerase primary sigma factor